MQQTLSRKVLIFMLITSLGFLLGLMGITYMLFRFNALSTIHEFMETLNQQTLDTLSLSNTEVNEIVYQSKGLTEWKIVNLFWRQYSLLFLAIGIAGIIFTIFITFGIHHLVSKNVKKVLVTIETFPSENVEKIVPEFQPILDELEQSRQNIRKITEQNEQFRSFSSHELRNQLTILRGLYDAYELEHPDLLVQITSLKETVENLLMLSYLPSDIQLVEIDIILSVAMMIDQFSDKMEMKWNYQEEQLETKVLGTENLLHRCLYNLLDNAYRYRTKGTTVEVAVIQHEKTITLTIKNQSDKASFETIEGHGIGLQLVKHVVGIMEGYYYVEFNEETVTTYIALPII